ncbi:hypothetical protein, conserved [Eimeria acervulina]|uniref:Transmembrane protein n=1 Tax=Eimeria acervulina TaxID=5801 RepID=U6GYF9_EIMAC|nr:hypothetical protein, conserved [Eimeria acervulina]CDI84273.1 hypothetical protein, conserved [Eimeria acervulina]
MRQLVFLLLCFPSLCRCSFLSANSGAVGEEAATEVATTEPPVTAATVEDAADATVLSQPEADAAAEPVADAAGVAASPAEPPSAAAADTAASASPAPVAERQRSMDEETAPYYLPLGRAIKTREFWLQRASELVVMVVTVVAVFWAYGQMGCPFKRWPLRLLVEQNEHGQTLDETEIEEEYSQQEEEQMS